MTETDTQKTCAECADAHPISAFYRIKGERTTARCRSCICAGRRAEVRARRGLPLGMDRITPGTPARPDGHTYVDATGYVREKRVGHRRANATGYVFQHILVMEGMLGISIPSTYTIHHINGDRSDNRRDNLQLRAGPHGKGGDVLPTLIRSTTDRAAVIQELLGNRDYLTELIAAMSARGLTVLESK